MAIGGGGGGGGLLAVVVMLVLKFMGAGQGVQQMAGQIVNNVQQQRAATRCAGSQWGRRPGR